MTDYTKLVEALRRCAEPGTIIDECDTTDDCPYSIDGYCGDCMNNLVKDAADAIEELQQIAAHYEQSAKDWWKEAREYKIKSAEGITAEESKEIIKRFKSIPCGPIEPLPKRGHWEPVPDPEGRPYKYVCSNCHRFHVNEDEWYGYCPNCGAVMGVPIMDGPIITPCRGCSDYDGYGGCKSKGGCAREKKEVQE